MPISCHFRDCKAFLMVTSAWRCSTYLTFTETRYINYLLTYLLTLPWPFTFTSRHLLLMVTYA